MFALTVLVLSLAYLGRTEPPRDSCPAPEEALGLELLRFGLQINRLERLTGDLEGLMADLDRFLETGRAD